MVPWLQYVNRLAKRLNSAYNEHQFSVLWHSQLHALSLLLRYTFFSHFLFSFSSIFLSVFISFFFPNRLHRKRFVARSKKKWQCDFVLCARSENLEKDVRQKIVIQKYLTMLLVLSCCHRACFVRHFLKKEVPKRNRRR